MPLTKQAIRRYRAIDQCLSNRQRIWTTDALLAVLSTSYNEHTGSNDGVGRTTLFDDLQAMKEGGDTGFDAPICYSRKKGHHYTVPGYSIFRIPLTGSDVVILQQALHALQAIRGIGLATALDDIIRRMNGRLALAGSLDDIPTILQFEEAPNYTGTNWLQPLYDSIQRQQPVRLGYQSYRAMTATEQVVHPYLLKSYQHRWFLLGYSPAKAELQVFALDRITACADTAVAYVPSAVNFDTHFQHVIGPTVPAGEQPTTVHLRFAHGRAPYVQTKPLHPTQCEVASTPAGLELTLYLVPNPELVTRLLSFGADVEVLAPATLRATMRKRLRAALASYNN
ncbi:WYL domain-containing protein [Hymenobacter setariae]|uniref:WYL domain-containing protein n=1 Tax=Hymenobacter setariae TaxID=2594794 RepID=A0A558BZE1_9BACT|nr:WYL domain-containing protein [Hymenobacter setariae]TVT41857.1 WYL domain-containing protein [Hymenobacter setariae]